MALFFAEDPHHGPGRRTGFDRYRQLLERDYMAYLLGGFLSLLAFVPFAAGMFFAFLSSSLLVMLGAALVGGVFAGPALYALQDLLFRSLRDASGQWWTDYKTALRRGIRSALIPGIVLCLFLGVILFAGMLMFWWAVRGPDLATIAVYLFSILLSLMIFSTYWPQLVLFEQKNVVRLRNCLLFCLKYFWRTLGTAALQAGFGIIMLLFLPWSALALPILGIWFICFLSDLILYPQLDSAFGIEEAIRKEFPDQIQDEEE